MAPSHAPPEPGVRPTLRSPASEPLSSEPLPSFENSSPVLALPERAQAESAPPGAAEPPARGAFGTLPPLPRASASPPAFTAPPARTLPAPESLSDSAAEPSVGVRLTRVLSGAGRGLPRVWADIQSRLPPAFRVNGRIAAPVLGVVLLLGLGFGVRALLPSGRSAQTVAAVELGPAQKTPIAVAPVQSAAPESAQPAASAAFAAQTRPATASPDEPSVLLELARSLLAQHRDADVPPLLERLIARHPELKDDSRVAELMLRSASSNNGRAAADSYALLTGQMGEPGAALTYELSLHDDVPGPSRLRAEKWLTSKAFQRVAALPVYAAAKLRGAKTCADKHALLAFAGNVGGKYVLDYLHEVEQKTSCSPEDLVHCYPCMREDTRLSDTISELERR